MDRRKLTTILNLSNQANCADTFNSDLFQLNFVAVIGQKYFNIFDENQVPIPLSINIGKSGEVEINGMSSEAFEGNSMRIYSDKKITHSKEA